MLKKSIILFFVSILVTLVISSVLNQTEQHKAFIENIGEPISDEKTKFIEQFYFDIAVIWNDYIVLDRSEPFNNIVKSENSKHSRFMTVDLLYVATDSNFVYDAKKAFLL